MDLSNIFYVFRCLLPDRKSEWRERKKKLRAGGFCGYVNIKMDGPNYIYLFGTSYAHTLPSESMNKHTVPSTLWRISMEN